MIALADGFGGSKIGSRGAAIFELQSGVIYDKKPLFGNLRHPKDLSYRIFDQR